MKRYVLVVFSLVLLCNLAQAADFCKEINLDKKNITRVLNQDFKDLSNVVEKEIIVTNAPFVNNRVKKICKQWPTCKEWVENKLVKDQTFKVIDTEVERWVSKWEDKQAIWEYKFYVQTQEEGKTKAYLFTRGIEGFPYNEPVLIKKFPGHPIFGKPSRDILQAAEEYASRWPGCSGWEYYSFINRQTSSQYIYQWDDEGKALWVRYLYVKVSNWSLPSTKYFYFRAYQTKANGDYIYEPPVEINNFPTLVF